jgi:anti-sigma-K factor RskA
MNTHELIEYTMLHALGLLEDGERQAYEAAFDAAPTSVQKRVREEARRMADLGDLIPEVEPNTELRDVVLAAVRAAIREDENELRIAQENAAGSPVVGRIDPSTASPSRVTSQPRLSKSPRVNRLWRVAGIGFAAASIAMGAVMINIQQTLQEANRNGFVNSFYDEIGARYLDDTIFNENTQRVILVSTDASNTSRASVIHNPDWDSALLVVKNLANEQNRPLRLVVLDENDNIVEVVKTFTPSGERENFEIEMNMSTSRKLAIYPEVEQEILDEIEPMYVSIDSSL